MTENEWDACDMPHAMFDHLGRTVSARKLRLFGVACCRRIWDLMTDANCRHAVLLAERLADGQASSEDAGRLRDQLKSEFLALAKRAAHEDKDAAVRRWCLGAAKNTLQDDEAYLRKAVIRAGDADLLGVWEPASSAVASHYEDPSEDVPGALMDEFRAQADLLREILGNPFRPATVSPAWLAWNNGAILKMAQAIYDARAFDRLPLLADALEEAGCENADILSHCCSGSEHVRGCCVVDLLLGKT